jgi:hypothetical protein
LGLPPGPALGAIVATLRAAQVRGEIGTAAEALALARRVAPGAAGGNLRPEGDV